MDKMHSSKAQTSEISFNEALVLKDYQCSIVHPLGIQPLGTLKFYQCSIVHPVSVQPLGTFKLKTNKQKKKTQKKGKSFWKINTKYEEIV